MAIDTIGPGNLLIGNVLDNDVFFLIDDSFLVDAQINSPCFRLDRETGNLFFTSVPGEECCGEYFIPYTLIEHNGCQDPDLCRGEIYIQIKCPKPDCSFVDLSEIGGDPSTGDNQSRCIQACENSTATYYIDYTPGHTYVWEAENGAVSFSPAPPAQVDVSWGPVGPPTSLSLYVTSSPSGTIDTVRFCVELTISPIADFTFEPTACRDQPVCFTNTSSGAASYLWNFGDGNYATTEDACNVYAAGGTYEVVLYATSAGGTDEFGNELCCCTDSIAMTITVDDLPGPIIYWVSTLCEGDESVYWTDAENCTTYNWVVRDADGNLLPFSFPGAGQDSIFVSWGDGPQGTIELTVEGCDEDYCDLGTTVIVPIISSDGDIDGAAEVCQGDTELYELPKWNGVSYQWTVTGGTINGSDTSHMVSVTWGGIGTGTLTVEYGSDFLAGLPGHSSADCYGTGYFEVQILGNFTVTDFSGGQACITSGTFIGLSSDYPGATFNWTISPGPVSFTTFPSGISIDWSTSPGIGLYTITATPLAPGPGDYCIAERSVTVNVTETPIPDGILGPLDYCVGDTLVYSVANPVPGFGYNWLITGGNIVSGFGTPNVVVVWTNPISGNLQVSAFKTNPVYCQSNPVNIMTTAIDLLPLTGLSSSTACINQTQTYSVLPSGQHPDTEFNWTITPPENGTVISGQGTETVTIQWNNSTGTAAIDVVATLCAETETWTQPIVLFLPTVPVIAQSNDLCPGVTADLSVNGALFSSVLWSTGATTPTITISSGGLYVVNTVDLNGCESVASIVPNELDGPSNTLTVAGPSDYCVTNASDNPTGTTVDLLTAFEPGYVYQWFCNGVLQATTGPTLTHVVTDTAMTFNYYFIVTDMGTGCMATSATKQIVQRVCIGGPTGCPRPTFPLNALATNQNPNCDLVDLSGSITGPIINIQWFLPVGSGATVISGSLGTPNATVQFPEAECYTLASVYTYLTANGDTCSFRQLHTVCIPLVANFDYVDDCGTVTFTNQSTTLGGAPIDSVRWNFGAGTSTLDNPVFTFTGPGPHTVTLTAYAGGCVSQETLVFSPGPNMNPVINVPPGALCVGEAIAFGATAPGAIIWRWNFGDLATFVGQNPNHAYAAANVYTVTLEVEDGFGCIETTSTTITVTANPTPVDIVISPSQVVCDGDVVTLSVPSEPGITYLWSDGTPGLTTNVTTSGTYTVSLSTADGCTFTADSVEITFLPLPDATVTGSPFICSGEPAVLSGPSGPYTYEWIDMNGNLFSNLQTVMFGLGDVANGPYTLNVIEANGCSGSSVPIVLFPATSPTPEIELTSGTGCEGEPNVLSVTAASYDPTLVYTWSNGQSGPSTIAAGVGTYTVIALDPLTGCTGRDNYKINPLPDVCIVPVGCYETCTPDTLCGPTGAGLTYEWFYNNTTISLDRCLIASLTGTYHLEVTNSFGCTATTDSLYLVMIDCDSDGCEGTTTTITPQDEGDCCYALSYADAPAGTYGIQINSPDAGLVVSFVNPAYTAYVVDGNTYQLGDAVFGVPLDASSVGSAMTFCLADPTAFPQTIIIDYLDDTYHPFCSDTILVECEPEPSCVYVTNDTIVCDENGAYELTMTICRPGDADFDIGYVQFLPGSLAAEDDFPLGLTISPALSAIMPCTTITITLTTLAVPDSDFCFSVVAHSGDPANDPTALCCSSEESYCLTLPDCDPCDDLGIISANPTNDEDCCYAVTLFNEVTDPLLDGIVLCPLDLDANLTAFTSLGGGWLANTGTGNALNLTPTAGSLPLGQFSLPEICLSDNNNLVTLVELKWMAGDSVVCRDTLELKCLPDCGFLEVSEVFCEGNQYYWTGLLTNTSGYPMSSAYFEFDPTSGLSAYNTTIDFGGAILPGGSIAITLPIGTPAGPGDVIWVNVYLHEENDDNDHLNCCVFKATLVMPDCVINDCLCNEEDFFSQVNANFSIVIAPSSAFLVLNPLGEFSNCDSIVWDSRPPGQDRTVIGEGYNFVYTLPSSGFYSICMIVYRTDVNGEVCSRRRCRSLTIGAGPVVFPNPAVASFSVEIPRLQPMLDPAETTAEPTSAETAHFRLMNASGKTIRNFTYQSTPNDVSELYRFDASKVPAGVYFLHIVRGEERWVRKVVIR